MQEQLSQLSLGGTHHNWCFNIEYPSDVYVKSLQKYPYYVRCVGYGMAKPPNADSVSMRGHVCCLQPVRLSQLVKWLPGVTFILRDGTYEDAIAWCVNYPLLCLYILFNFY
jgi:hypothetical protein